MPTQRNNNAKKAPSRAKKAAGYVRKARRRAKRNKTRRRAVSAPVVMTALIFIIGIAYAVYLEYGNSAGKEVSAGQIIGEEGLSVHFIDVGQGDCSLILTESAAVLIDAGEVDEGAAAVDYIKSLGVERLDIIIATHPHSDHIGGLPDVIKAFDAGKIIVPRISEEMTPTTKTYENFLEAVRNKGLRLTAAKRGDIYALSEKEDEITIEILAPISDQYDNLNNYSVVCSVSYGDVSFLFTGDIEKEVEEEILDASGLTEADVLKVPHHGSGTSSSEEFLYAVNPGICVIQCGAGNSYGHPNAEAIERLLTTGADIYRTDLGGTVIAVSDEKTVSVTQ